MPNELTDPVVVISVCCRDYLMAETARWIYEECRIHKNYQFQLINTPFPVDHQRNLQIQQFLATKWATHLFLLDSDEIPKHGTIEVLLADDKPIAAAPSYRYANGHLEMMVYTYDHANSVFFPRLPDMLTEGYRTIQVDGVGVSGLLLRRDVVEQLSPVRCEYDKRGILILDDSLAISKQLMALGYKIPVHLDLVQTHVKLIPLK